MSLQACLLTYNSMIFVSAKLTCLIGVKSDYPQSSCVFAVEIDYEPLNKSQESTSYSLVRILSWYFTLSSLVFGRFYQLTLSVAGNRTGS